LKLFDLSHATEMTPIMGLLFGMVSYNNERLTRSVYGLNQEQIDFKGMNNDLNSIAQLLRHLTVVNLYWVYRLQSLTLPESLKEKFGPMYDDDGKLPSIKDVSLQTLLEEYDQTQKMLRDVCLMKTDSELDQVVPFENGNTATVRWGIWHIADHSRHHSANIVQLKKIMQL
jgi:uncharacterized damage-inducible protein DinB